MALVLLLSFAFHSDHRLLSFESRNPFMVPHIRGPVPGRSADPHFAHSHFTLHAAPRRLAFVGDYGLLDASRFLAEERWRGGLACECGIVRPVSFFCGEIIPHDVHRFSISREGYSAKHADLSSVH